MTPGTSGAGPKVLYIAINPLPRDPSSERAQRQFRVTFHFEGTGRTLLQEVLLDAELEQHILERTDALMWGGPTGFEGALALGRILHETFIGPLGEELLDAAASQQELDAPTAGVLLDIDETILHLPWELLNSGVEMLAQRMRFGRVVTTRRPAPAPRVVDGKVDILAIIDPTGELTMADRERDIIDSLKGRKGGGITVRKPKFLEYGEATVRAVKEELQTGNYEMVHFAGHSYFNRDFPGASALELADGVLTANDILRLRWGDQPPVLFFTSSCQSTAAAAGHPLVSSSLRGNGLAGALHASGVESFGGFFWPVTDTGACMFVDAFYEELFRTRIVGEGFLAGRRAAAANLPFDDLTASSAVLYGDMSLTPFTSRRPALPKVASRVEVAG